MDFFFGMIYRIVGAFKFRLLLNTKVVQKFTVVSLAGRARLVQYVFLATNRAVIAVVNAVAELV